MPATELNMMRIILESGFVVKGVLLALILGSIISWAIVFMKRRMINEMKKNNSEFYDLYKAAPNLTSIYEQIGSLPYSPFGNLFANGYEELQKFKSSAKVEEGVGSLREHFNTFGLEGIERGLKKGSNQSNLELEKSLSTLASIGSIAPFVGLFGTVWGIIDSFTGIAGGGATLDAVAPGIAEALVATAVGLLAAIPAVWFFNYFSSQNQAINTEMENFEQDFLNVVERSLI